MIHEKSQCGFTKLMFPLVSPAVGWGGGLVQDINVDNDSEVQQSP